MGETGGPGAVQNIVVRIPNGLFDLSGEEVKGLKTEAKSGTHFDLSQLVPSLAGRPLITLSSRHCSFELGAREIPQ